MRARGAESRQEAMAVRVATTEVMAVMVVMALKREVMMEEEDAATATEEARVDRAMVEG